MPKPCCTHVCCSCCSCCCPTYIFSCHCSCNYLKVDKYVVQAANAAAKRNKAFGEQPAAQKEEEERTAEHRQNSKKSEADAAQKARTRVEEGIFFQEPPKPTSHAPQSVGAQAAAAHGAPQNAGAQVDSNPFSRQASRKPSSQQKPYALGAQRDDVVAQSAAPATLVRTIAATSAAAHGAIPGTSARNTASAAGGAARVSVAVVGFTQGGSPLSRALIGGTDPAQLHLAPASTDTARTDRTDTGPLPTDTRNAQGGQAAGTPASATLQSPSNASGESPAAASPNVTNVLSYNPAAAIAATAAAAQGGGGAFIFSVAAARSERIIPLSQAPIRASHEPIRITVRSVPQS